MPESVWAHSARLGGLLGPLTLQLMLMMRVFAGSRCVSWYGPWATHPAADAHDARLRGLTISHNARLAGVFGSLTLQLMLMMRVFAGSQCASCCWGPWATDPAADAHDARLRGLPVHVLVVCSGHSPCS